MGIAVAVLGLAAAAYWNALRNRATPDAPLPGPAFLNRSGAVRYVGSASCAACHAELFGRWQESPMGQALRHVSESDGLEDYEQHTSFVAGRTEYQVVRSGAQVFHLERQRADDGEPVYEQREEITYVLGAGRGGRSYLVDRGGFLFVSPISWYSQRERWGLALGYDAGRPPHFDREVREACLYCHTGRAPVEPGSINHFVEQPFREAGISCERCHGPGELHAARHSQGASVPGEPDLTIVNPRHLPPPLRESVCLQCHLEGTLRLLRRGKQLADFRPGLALESVLAVFGPALASPEGQRSRPISQVEQMVSSRCYAESAGRLGCISCHNPHERPDPQRAATYYRERCLACHETQACALPLPQRAQPDGDNCVACHMPRFNSREIAHTAFTDHRIPRRPEPVGLPEHPDTSRLGQDGPDPTRRGIGQATTNLVDDPADWVDFFRRGVGDEPDRARDWANMLAMLAHHRSDSRLALQAVAGLRRSVRAWPDDVPSLQSLGEALQLCGDLAEAAECFRRALTLDPRSERALIDWADLAVQAGQTDQARDLLERLSALDPYQVRLQFARAQLYRERGEFRSALDVYDQVLRLNASVYPAHLGRAFCFMQLDDRENAARELRRYLRFGPQRAEPLEALLRGLERGAAP